MTDFRSASHPDARSGLRPDAPQLIAYADRLAGDLRGLRALLDGPFAGAFGGVHVLPFFVPIDGADAGFDPTDHTAVDPRLGDWEDVAALAQGRTVMADLICNHVADRSAPYLDWLEHGEASAYDGMFLTLSSVFPEGATEDDLAAIYRPRPGLPFTRVRTGDGRTRMVWTTFTPQQIDIDVTEPQGWSYLVGILDRFATAGVTMVRLDAVGYAVKQAGTTCFMLPETFAFIDRLSAEARSRGMQVLVEIHGYHRTQIDVASHVDLVYDFALPPLVLDALFRADATPLRTWLAIRPRNAINVLDTHDGIGVIDVGADATAPDRPGLLDPVQLSALVEGIHDRSGGGSRLATGAAASNLDLYQVNCTFYDALGRDDERYLLARLVQLLVPGVSQIYYVGLLAGTNDVELLTRTGVGRDVNRHRYDSDEVAEALDRPVVRALLAMLRWRATCPAFDGECSVLDAPAHVLALRWQAERHLLEVRIDLAAATFELLETGPAGSRTVREAAAL
jgi:sucrose phosphorylase